MITLSLIAYLFCKFLFKSEIQKKKYKIRNKFIYKFIYIENKTISRVFLKTLKIYF